MLLRDDKSDRREIMAPGVDIHWWKWLYLDVRTCGSKWRKTIFPAAWGVGSLFFHYRPEGSWGCWCMHVLGRLRYKECEFGDSLGRMDSKILSSFHCCENTLMKATSRRKGLFSLVAPGYSPSWRSSQGGPEREAAVQSHPVKKQRGMNACCSSVLSPALQSKVPPQWVDFPISINAVS